VSRFGSLARLAAAYGAHRAAQPFRRQHEELRRLLAQYRGDHLVPLTEGERALLPAMSRCINCGLCAFAAGRLGQVTLPDLASAYLRDYPRLPAAAEDIRGPLPDFTAAEAACPVGVPLRDVARMVARLAGT
jgi:ferredoxin